MRDGIEYLPYVWTGCFAVILAWTIFDMLATPHADWRRAGYRKYMWIWGSFVLGFAIAPFVVTVYVARVRPRLREEYRPRNRPVDEPSMVDVLRRWPSGEHRR